MSITSHNVYYTNNAGLIDFSNPIGFPFVLLIAGKFEYFPLTTYKITLKIPFIKGIEKS